jgi:hypothetical protein
MDQLADLLRARTANGRQEDVPEGVRALLGCLDERASDAAPANAADAPNAAAADAPNAAAAADAPSSSSPFGVDVAIHGPGAAGSTHLANFLLREAGLRCNLLVDPDGLRHAPWPPPPPPASPPAAAAAPAAAATTSLVYLYSGDPLLAAASFFRRGIAAEQALKTCGAAALASAPPGEARDRTQTALALAAGASGAQSFPPTLDAFLQRGEDRFGLDAHLRGWLERPAAADVVFLRYERAFAPEVARALFRRLLREARARRRRRSGQENKKGEEGEAEEEELELEARAERLADVWCAQRRERRSQPTERQRAGGGRVFAAFSARVKDLPHGGCFVRPADVSEKSCPQGWAPLV